MEQTDPPAKVASNDQLGPTMRDRAKAGLRALRVVLGLDSPETRGWAPVVQQEARRTLDNAIAVIASDEAVIYARGASFKEALTEVERLRELADSEGTRAVECLRRARKAEAVLRELADACAEVADLTPQAYRDKVLTLGARARVLVGPNVALRGEPAERAE